MAWGVWRPRSCPGNAECGLMDRRLRARPIWGQVAPVKAVDPPQYLMKSRREMPEASSLASRRLCFLSESSISESFLVIKSDYPRRYNIAAVGKNVCGCTTMRRSSPR